MSLDVFVQSTPNHRDRSHDEHVLSFDDDEGIYWFLYPLFQQLAARTGQDIDLYGVAIFGEDALGALEQTIDLARQLTEQQPESWEVVTAIEVGKPPREICALVSKRTVLALLDKLAKAVAEAREQKHYVTFLGD